MKTIRIAMALALGAALAGCGTPPKKPTAESPEIVIAVAGPMSGDLAEFGVQVRRGAEKAVADVNAAGGVLGKKLRLEIGDDACDPKRAAGVANDLVERGAVFVDGHFCSGSSIPASAIYQAAGVLQITPSSSNPALTDDAAGKTLFRVCGRDDRQGTFAGTWLAEHDQGKRVAIVYDRAAYGRLVAGAVRDGLSGGGLREVMYEGYAGGEQDFSGIVSRLKEAKADVLYVAGYHPDAALILREMRAQGVQVPMVGPDAFETTEFVKLAGAAADGVMFTADADLRGLSTAGQVVAALRHDGFEPEGYTLYSYAAVQVWAAAAAKAGTTEAAKVAETLRSRSWDTAIGPLAFDAKGDATRQPYVWYVFRNGRYAEAGM